MIARPSPDRKALDVTMMHDCSWSYTCLPARHSLSRARLRHLRQSDCVVVTEDAVPVGLAAYKHADSDVRVVHEFLVDPILADCDVTRVTDALLAALELVAHDDRVYCLIILLCGDVVTTPFEKHGYNSIGVDPCRVWLQRKLDGLTWTQTRSGSPAN